MSSSASKVIYFEVETEKFQEIVSHMQSLGRATAEAKKAAEDAPEDKSKAASAALASLMDSLFTEWGVFVIGHGYYSTFRLCPDPTFRFEKPPVPSLSRTVELSILTGSDSKAVPTTAKKSFGSSLRRKNSKKHTSKSNSNAPANESSGSSEKKNTGKSDEKSSGSSAKKSFSSSARRRYSKKHSASKNDDANAKKSSGSLPVALVPEQERRQKKDGTGVVARLRKEVEEKASGVSTL